MAAEIKKEIRAYGIKVLLSRHLEIRRLKQYNIPTSHGNKFWTSSWLLMDYFKRRGLAEGSRVMEIGCGWGLAGIYCAKRHGAVVTGVDIDPDVLPFARLHADINNVDIRYIRRGFNGLRVKDFSKTDVLIGADICFWDEMVDPLRRLIRRAIRSGVKLALIADPVRSPFEELGLYFKGRDQVEILDWSVKRPRPIRGQILRVAATE